MHRGPAQMYVADPRYSASYVEIAPGFSRYVHDAILANADRADPGPQTYFDAPVPAPADPVAPEAREARGSKENGTW
jgi:hypothetical protein